MRYWLLLVMMAGLAFSQPRAQDVIGWDRIAWGMTIAEARSIYPAATGAGNRERLTLEPVLIGDLTLNVTVSAGNDSDRISRVELSNPDAGARKFDRLKVLLIQKYGAPINESTKIEDANTSVTTLIWTFPSTAILLTLRQGRGIYLEYTAIDKDALNLL